MCGVESIVANCDQSTRIDHADQLREKLFPGIAFNRVMGAIAEWIIRFMRMQREDIP